MDIVLQMSILILFADNKNEVRFFDPVIKRTGIFTNLFAVKDVKKLTR